MKTKDQERAALAKIQAILDDMGPDSYVGMAFAGCCELAAENIQNDFGLSMKDRAETAEMESDRYKAAYKEALHKAETLEKRILTTEEARGIKEVLHQAYMDAGKAANDAAQEILDHAEDPESNEFWQAVENRKQALHSAEKMNSLIQRLLDTMK